VAVSVTLDAIGTALPAELTCAECGDTLERGYVPVEVTESGTVNLGVEITVDSAKFCLPNSQKQ
jgi:hypothetical protein